MMGKPLKIVLMTLLLLLVVFSVLADLPVGQKFQGDIKLGTYLKWVSLLGLVIAAFAAWGYRSQVVASQKYRRADEVVAKAEASYALKKNEVRRAYKKRLKELKEQNMELKETVGKLMRTLKRERQQRD
ncbi:MAG: hypothetical protein P8X96_25735 [Desulfobacteraceae bacterium]